MPATHTALRFAVLPAAVAMIMSGGLAHASPSTHKASPAASVSVPSHAEAASPISMSSAEQGKTPATAPAYSSAAHGMTPAEGKFPAPQSAETKPAEPKAAETKPAEAPAAPAVPDAVRAAGDSHSAPLKLPAQGMALVRVIDGTASSADVKINGKTYSAAANSIGKYYSMPAGPVEILNGAERTSFSLSGGELYSVLVGKGKLEVRQEPRLDSSKAQFVLVNLSGAPGVSIKTSPGAASDIGPAEPGSVATAIINPINVTFGVYDANHTLLATLTGLTLEKGSGYAVLVYTGRDGKPAVAYGKASGG